MKKSAMSFLLKNKEKNKLLEVIYFLYQKDKEIKIKEISQLAFMSIASITRFFQNNGFEGFYEFKMLLKNDDQDVKEDQTHFDGSLESEMIFQPIRHTANLNDDDIFEKTYNLLNNANESFIIAVGGNNSVGYELQTRLERLGFRSNFTTDIHSMWIKINNASKNDILFAISYSGETSEIVKIVRRAKEKGIKVVVISRIGETTLSNLADVLFKVDSTENIIRIVSLKSRISMFYLISRLTMYIYAKNPNKYNELLLTNLYT